MTPDANLEEKEKTDFSLLHHLRKIKPAHKKIQWHGSNMGEQISDWLAKVMGSWQFIIIQSLLLLSWIVLNLVAWISAWDPYPFILLNLVLSFQAAFTAPIIMMSQNRQSAIDRQKAENDYTINVKAELEIELLHLKIDLLREKEIQELLAIIRTLEQRLAPSP